ncbi:hypothetical protein [Caballeronia sp. J97]|uniref:hypothetical protein n=1 Tax=Caballeronia sp. J97 TaxID=2805429 RepID=UPI002AB11605|nr:hypothetical protein [Caballeronia sp. J97]
MRNINACGVVASGHDEARPAFVAQQHPTQSGAILSRRETTNNVSDVNFCQRSKPLRACKIVMENAQRRMTRAQKTKRRLLTKPPLDGD